MTSVAFDTTNPAPLAATEHQEWPDMPLRDEEYFEWVSVAEAVDRAAENFVMIELGAGYGRWLVNAACLAQQRPELRCHLVGVEAEPEHFRMMRRHFICNGLVPQAHTLVEAAVVPTGSTARFIVGAADRWYGQRVVRQHGEDFTVGSGTYAREVAAITVASLLEPFPRVDLIDMDIQGSESDVVAASVDVLDQKVRRLHIATHSTQVEHALRELLSGHGWIAVFDFPHASTTPTPYGVIQFADGVQVWENRQGL